MSRNHRPVLLGLVLAASVSAQVVYIDDNNPATGVSNAFPFAQINGFTTLHVYTAAQLAAGGVCAGAMLTDIAIAPSNGTSGTYNAPQARLSVGHLANDPPIAGGWESNIANPTVIHDLTSGPVHVPVDAEHVGVAAGVATTSFAWDGSRASRSSTRPPPEPPGDSTRIGPRPTFGTPSRSSMRRTRRRHQTASSR